MSISSSNRERLAKLRDAFEIVWATSWQHLANQHLSPALGLPELEFVNFKLRFHEGRPLVPGDIFGHCWKHPTLARFRPGQPLAWVDDNHSFRDRDWWQDERPNCLLVTTEPELGLTDAQVEQLLEFAAHA